jgi:HEAT repeat protein
MKRLIAMYRTRREYEIEKSVERLNNLGNNMSALIEVLKYGKAAVGPLVGFLLSPPSIFSEPRCLAAEALGMIGGREAVEGLIQVLDLYDLESLDPQVRFAEETVRNQAAKNLGTLGDELAREPLLKSLKEDHLRGAAQALASYREVRAIPYIIEMLEDDYARETASNALLKFGKNAVQPLIETLSRKIYTNSENEKRLSVTRRVEAARLLGEIGDPRAIQPLVMAIEDEQWKVRLFSGLSILEIGGVRDETIKAVSELIAGLNEGDWYTHTLCIDSMSVLNSFVLPYIESALSENDIENARGERIDLTHKAVQSLKEVMVRINHNKGKGNSINDNIKN